jgi:hypothetical protein
MNQLNMNEKEGVSSEDSYNWLIKMILIMKQ